MYFFLGSPHFSAAAASGIRSHAMVNSVSFEYEAHTVVCLLLEPAPAPTVLYTRSTIWMNCSGLSWRTWTHEMAYYFIILRYIAY